MARYQLTIAYDGTHFLGFQRQAKGRTVQSSIESALRQLGWDGKSVLAAGRTDSGAHALGQVIAFDFTWSHGVQELQEALNASLPMDIVVKAASEVTEGFHPRFDACSRCYHYHIYCRNIRDPFLDRFAWRVWPEVDLESLQQAAECLLGTHEFAAFGTPPAPGGSTLRTIRYSGWQVVGDEIVFEIVSEAFLYHMIRRLVYVQVAIGQKKMAIENLRELLAGGSRSLVKGMAPANGLVLVEVSYPPQ